jgi:hypothetical protein
MRCLTLCGPYTAGMLLMAAPLSLLAAVQQPAAASRQLLAAYVVGCRLEWTRVAHVWCSTRARAIREIAPHGTSCTNSYLEPVLDGCERYKPYSPAASCSTVSLLGFTSWRMREISPRSDSRCVALTATPP